MTDFVHSAVSADQPGAASHSGDAPFLNDADEMSRAVRAFDWAATPLGPLATWPAHLKSTAALMLSAPFPTMLWWGPQLIQLFNAPCRECFDTLTADDALGQPAAPRWAALWPAMATELATVHRTGAAVRHHDLLIPLARDGCVGQRYFTYAFIPVRGDSGAIDGILVTVSESTQRVLSDRRLATIDALRGALADCSNCAAVALAAHAAAAAAPDDLHGMRFPGEPQHRGPGTRIAIEANDVALAGSFELEFFVSDSVPVDAPCLRFLEQFAAIVGAALRRVNADTARAVARDERDRLLLDAPVGAAVMIGASLTYQLVNAIYAEVSGRPADSMVGKPFTEVFPELDGSPVHQSFMAVYHAGTAFVGGETLVQIHKHGGALEDRYFTYNLSPLRRLDGTVYGLMVIAVDITLQVEARTQIEQLNLELNAAARAKDEFLALLGHELRNPLAPIVTALELMKMRDASTQREQAVIQRQVNHLRRLVDDLLDVSRITRGKIALRKERVNLADILHKSVEMVHANVERKQQSLTVDVGPIPLLVDPDRLAQVVSNLLTNASRYTPQGGRLALRAWRSGAHVHIEMQDDGEGIPAALLPRIFEPFVQGTRKLQASVGGLGIGLALVKNLTELHGGSVAASSAGEGRGSVFAVTIPAAIDDQPGATPAPVPTQTARAPLARRKILVVDDNEDAANFLAELLSVLGQTVLVAYNAADALRLCSTLAPAQWPDLAVLDLGLPDLDGYQLADRLRLLPGGAHLPCVALTGYGQEADKARSRAARFTGHLVKPVERKDLLGLFATLDQ